MRKRSMLDSNEVGKKVRTHLVFVFLLGIGAFFRVASDAGDDGNVVAFAMVLATGVIFALSIFNQFIIGLFNDLNGKWKIVNYCAPAMIMLLMLLVFRIPVELVDLVMFPTLILIADIVMYTTEQAK